MIEKACPNLWSALYIEAKTQRDRKRTILNTLHLANSGKIVLPFSECLNCTIMN